MTLTKTFFSIFIDVILNERGYKKSTSQQTMCSSMPYYKTIEISDKPISACLLDQMKNDAKFFHKNPRIGDEAKGRDLIDFLKLFEVFESLKSFEPKWNQDSTTQEVTNFLKKASKILQQTIKILDLKGGEQVFELNLAANVQEEPYHLCFVQYSPDYIFERCWLSISPKNVQNTMKMEPTLE